MSFHLNNILDVLEGLLRDLRDEYIVSAKDPVAAIRRRVYNRFYKPVKLSEYPRKPIGFVDAGFTSYQLDVANIIPLQVAGIMRSEDGRLYSLKQLLGVEPVELVIVYTSRRRAGNGYRVVVRIRSPVSKGLLFETRYDAERVSRELNKLFSSAPPSPRIGGAKALRRISKYLEGLIELAYAVKMYSRLRENGLEYVVLDGSLIRWFSVREPRILGEIDGLHIASILTGYDVKSLKKNMARIIGLSKTTSSTRIIRSQDLFRQYYGEEELCNLYSIIDGDGAEEVVELLNKYLKEGGLGASEVLEIIKMFNRIVYPYNNVFVVRFPLTMDGKHVFTLDIYSEAPVIGYRRGSVYFYKDIVPHINSFVSNVVHTMYVYRTRISSEPPYGFMEVDSLVRMRGELDKFFTDAVLALLPRLGDDKVIRILEQVFSPTTRMRYGYR
ncbi:MAG: hypothetical protein J7K21_00145 [Desulfurococcales archaeon]|nr:hypothetical protein [Desulfurococcales archaeon]